MQTTGSNSTKPSEARSLGATILSTISICVRAASVREPRMIRKVRRKFGWTTDRWQSFCDHTQARFIRSESLVRERIPGIPTSTTRSLCLFSHYDPRGILEPYVVRTLENLRRVGCDIVFITTSPTLDVEARSTLNGLCREIIIRKNRSRDFGSWKTALDALGAVELERYDELVLANDSVYGPLFDLAECFEKMRGSADVWGITDNWEVAYHLQSYFLVINKRLLSSEYFRKFWRDFLFFNLRQSLIDRYEIGLSQGVLHAGFTIAAYCPYEKVRDCFLRIHSDSPFARRVKRTPINATRHFWDLLIRDFRCPFLKIEPFRTNPARPKNLREWKKVVAKFCPGFDTKWIEPHLLRITQSSQVVTNTSGRRK